MSVDRKPSSFALDSVDLDGYLVSLVDRMAGTTTLPADQHSELLDALSHVALAADRPRVEFLLSTLEAVRSRGPGYEVAFNIFSSHFAVRNEDFVLAEALCEVAHRSALALGREVEVAACCLIRGNVQLRLGNYRFARIHYDEAVVAARRSGARSLEGRASMNVGLTLKNLGDLVTAESVTRAALALAESADTPENAARCKVNLVNVLYRRGKFREALDLARSASSTLDELALVGLANSAHLAEARVMRLLGNAAAAQVMLEGTLVTARELAKPRNVVLALEFLGDCELDLGDPVRAREHYREALLLARGYGKETDLALECLRGLGACELACGAAIAAVPLVEESVAIARQQGDLFELGTSLTLLSRVKTELGDASAAEDALEEAYRIAGSIGDDHGRARAACSLAVNALASERPIDAVMLAAESRSLALRLNALELAADSSALLAKITDMPKVESKPARILGQRPTETAVAIPGFLTVDSRVKQALATVRKIAQRKLNILIHGESGTGKELIAQAVHTESGRQGPLVPVNCSAFPGDLIEGELFGHARGAYTGADRERAGLFEHANKGTLFLDEIGDMPLKAQARLLRALESGEVRRLGENSSRNVDVRVVAATHRDLMTMVGAGEFRLDLYYRLAGYVVELPPIRERIEDAKLLVDHYFNRFAREQGKTMTMTPELRQQLAGHSWPGNVREIRLVMDRLVSLSEDGAVVRSLPFALEGDPRPRTLPEHLEAEEKRRILDALQSHNWNKQRAATMLGTNRTTLIGKMKRMGISSRKP